VLPIETNTRPLRSFKSPFPTNVDTINAMISFVSLHAAWSARADCVLPHTSRQTSVDESLLLPGWPVACFCAIHCSIWSELPAARVSLVSAALQQIWLTSCIQIPKLTLRVNCCGVAGMLLLHHTNACYLPLRLLFCVQTCMHLSTCLVCTQVTPRLQLPGWHDMCMAACRQLLNRACTEVYISFFT
jgi:hypothetical protein